MSFAILKKSEHDPESGHLGKGDRIKMFRESNTPQWNRRYQAAGQITARQLITTNLIAFLGIVLIVKRRCRSRPP